jgi:hypothetical protein
MLMLYVIALKMRTKPIEFLEYVKSGLVILLIRQFLEVEIVKTLYFSDKFEVKSYISRAIIVLIFVLNFVLIKVFIDLEAQYSVHLAPALLLEIVLHFYMFLFMGI